MATRGIRCPECEAGGPKDNNGLKGMDMAFLCNNCGAQFDRECTCGAAYGEAVPRIDRCDHCAYVLAGEG